MRNKKIIFDVRCLQDINYRDRGVGRLGANLVRSARKVLSDSDEISLVAIVDPALPALEPRFRDSFDEIRENGYLGELRGTTWFIELSPMTHDPLFVARMLDCKQIFKMTIVHDFIPLRFQERYLPGLTDKINYQTKLFWLAQYDHFFPNSEVTARDLMEILDIPEDRISVTAAPIDKAFLKFDSIPSAPSNYIVVAGGADARKNVECALRAHANSAVCRARGTRLFITGNYPEQWVVSLNELYRSCGGTPSLLSMLPYLQDEQLAVLYRKAACLVVPSRIEGFSIPVVEGMAVQIPVFASAIPAHRELIDRSDLMFAPDDHLRLTQLIDDVLISPHFREQVVAAQGDRWKKFRADEIAQSFWRSAKKQASGRLAAPLVGGGRPRIAVLGPLPPDKSGVADYTAATFKELSKYADLYAFTATKSPIQFEGANAVAPISDLPHLTTSFDRVVGVMGNSHFHVEVFNQLMRYGGACIQHDNRLLGFYAILMGQDRSRRVAEKELGRPLEPGELDRWLADEATLEATFLGEIAERSDPLCVHSRRTARLVRERFQVNASYLPFSIYRQWDKEQFTEAHRRRARERLGFGPDEIAIVTFGYVATPKAPEECILALEMLRGWGIPAKLYFVGEMATDAGPLNKLCEVLGVAEHVHFASHYISEDSYRDYLLAGDIAVQLRTHLLGGLSGALLDCIAVGIPTVANSDLAEASEAPSYVKPIPDRPSPVLIAEAVATILESGATQRGNDEEREAYRCAHNLRIYAEQLCAALSLDVTRSESD